MVRLLAVVLCCRRRYSLSTLGGNLLLAGVRDSVGESSKIPVIRGIFQGAAGHPLPSCTSRCPQAQAGSPGSAAVGRLCGKHQLQEKQEAAGPRSGPGM